MKAVVLGAGKGKRLQSEKFNLPKVARQANGKALIEYVLDGIGFVDKSDTVIVVGYMKEKVMELLGPEYSYAVQSEQLGTGHAVAQAKQLLAGYDGPVLVCYGDMPLFKEETYRSLFEQHISQQNTCTLLSAVSEQALPYGRIVRDGEGRFVGVVEQKDCTPEQRLIKELNVGIYVFDCQVMLNALGKLKNNNAQGEYYLTDLPAEIIKDGGLVDVCAIHDDSQILGVNTAEDLEQAERLLAVR